MEVYSLRQGAGRPSIGGKAKIAYTVRFLMTELSVFKSSPKRLTADRSISISVSVHLAMQGETAARGQAPW